MSSTLIRSLVYEGRVSEAAKLLGRNYRLSGRVVRGNALGVKIGFPTANIKMKTEEKIVPGNGVYAALAHVEDMTYKSMLNIGYRPTFGGEERTIEVHLHQFGGDLYHKEINVEFVKRIRDEKKFESMHCLTNQLKNDKKESLHVLANV